jgi:hypothetical protein
LAPASTRASVLGVDGDDLPYRRSASGVVAVGVPAAFAFGKGRFPVRLDGAGLSSERRRSSSLSNGLLSKPAAGVRVNLVARGRFDAAIGTGGVDAGFVDELRRAGAGAGVGFVPASFEAGFGAGGVDLPPPSLIVSM